MSVLTQVHRMSHLPRGRRLARRTGRTARATRDRLLSTARRLPVPTPVRRGLGDALLWQPRLVDVPLDRLLLGGQNQLPASEFARLSGDLGWPSRRVLDGPHADLLRRGAAGPLSDAEILESPYGRMARSTIAAAGQYFAARDDAGIVAVARSFLDGRLGGTEQDAGRMPHQTRAGEPVRVVPIRNSDCYQVLDGHHRLAALGVAGAETATVRVKRVSVGTPLQDLLEQMSWTGGTRELYQPVDSPELGAEWVRVRRCTDRLDAMTRFLATQGIGPGASYLDVASCYGWFVDQFTRLGLDGEGVERDENGPLIGALAYGLDPGRITVSDAEPFLADTGRSWDVVSCFSLLHHFVLGRASIGPEELLSRLDRVTGRVLFLDSGQAHEAWFRDSLSEWDTDYLRAFVRRHTTFDDVVDLGPDADAVAPYEANYGRHLIAAVRDA